ncbi:MAG: MFS transporter [Rhodobacterales bacterium]|nr:MFS transporter [Rhodobacterales bacterium]
MTNGTLARGWLVWGLAALFYCYGFFQRVAPSVMVADLMADLSVNAAALGQLSAYYFYAYASLQIPVGLLLDRWGVRWVLTAAAALAALGSLLFGVAEGLAAASLGRFLVGTGAAFTWVGALTVATTWLPPQRFALVSGLTLMLGMAGAVGGQAPLAALVGAVGWRETMTGAAAVGLGLAVLLGLILRDRPRAPAAPEAAGGFWRNLGAALVRRQTLLAALYGAGMTGPMLAFGALWAVPYLMRAHGLDRPDAAFSASLMLIGWAIGAPGGGWLSDRLGRRRPVMLVASTGVLVTLGAAIYAPGLPVAAVQGLLLLNGVFGGGMVICFAAARDSAPAHQGAATMGVVNTAVMATGAAFQPLIGWLLDRNWTGAMADGARVYDRAAYETAFLTLVGCGIAALVAALLLKETGRAATGR